MNEVYGWVVQQSGRYAGEVYPLGRKAVLGSDATCDVVVVDADPRHVELVLGPDYAWSVCPLEKAVVKLDRERVTGASWPIRDGACLELNSAQVIFKCINQDWH